MMHTGKSMTKLAKVFKPELQFMLISDTKRYLYMFQTNEDKLYKHQACQMFAGISMDGYFTMNYPD